MVLVVWLWFNLILIKVFAGDVILEVNGQQITQFTTSQGDVKLFFFSLLPPQHFYPSSLLPPPSFLVLSFCPASSQT